MSEKWETVGTGKSTSRKATTGSKASSTKPAAKKEKMVYTMEDILPASSVVNTFASAFDPVPTPKSPKKEAKYVEYRKSPEKNCFIWEKFGKNYSNMGGWGKAFLAYKPLYKRIFL